MHSIKCSECGFVSWAGAVSCKQCGASLAPGGSEYRARNQHILQRDLKKGLAVFSLVLGVINLFTVGLIGIGAVLGIVISLVAMRRAKENPMVYGGKELATAGLVTSILSLVIIVPVGVIAAIAIPNLLAARRAANEGSTIAVLRKVHAAEATYQAATGAGEFGTLEQLAEAGLIDPEVASGVRNGYRFRVQLTTSLDDELGFEALGTPIDYPSSGRRSFIVDESGVIRGSDNQGAEATKHDSPLDSDRVDSFDASPRRLGYQQPSY